jgi:hypothetical protein
MGRSDVPSLSGVALFEELIGSRSSSGSLTIFTTAL